MKIYSAYLQRTKEDGTIEKYFLGACNADTREDAELWFASFISRCENEAMRKFFTPGITALKVDEYGNGLPVPTFKF